MKLVSGVKPVYWRNLKTEAINPRSNFHIIDDHLLWVETEWLRENSLLNRWIQVDTIILSQ
jgi:hypothetical protein